MASPSPPPLEVAESTEDSPPNIIGIVVGDPDNALIGPLSEMAAVEANRRGFEVRSVSGQFDPNRELEALETFRTLGVTFVMMIGTRLKAKAIESANIEVPLVAVACLPHAKLLDRVVVDDRQGGRLATEHLISLGHKDIAHIHGGVGPGGRERLAGFRDAMETAGLNSERVLGGGFTSDVGAKAAVELAFEPPSAILACSAPVAWGAISELNRQGLSVPGDVSVVGFDHSQTGAPMADFLTTIDGNRQALSRRGFELLLERLDGRVRPTLEIIPPKLKTRRSTRTV